YQETLYNFVQGCEINKLDHRPIKILEVGFGTGMGFICTIENCPKPIRFVSFEKHEEMVELAKEIHPLYKDLRKVPGGYGLQAGESEILILIGDARDRIKEIKEQFDAIYQDAFSPRKNKELWTKQWFKDLYKLSHDKTILSTYSSSVSIRKALIESGWLLSNRKGHGNKKLATIAKRTGETDKEIIEKLKRSSVEALSDEIISFPPN
ncbi:MAG: MnmC family methyltransferase, partial [Bdellovibrionales bacterium]|nr:MnmC family methyltransferase [Bdellovibrionales bacterium]